MDTQMTANYQVVSSHYTFRKTKNPIHTPKHEPIKNI